MRRAEVDPPLRMVKPTSALLLPADVTLRSCTSQSCVTPKNAIIDSRRLSYAVEPLVRLEAAMPDSVHDAVLT